MNYLSRIEVAFDITLVRRLSDMLDVNTKITGSLKNIAQVNDADGKAAQLILELPYTLVRTQAIERKRETARQRTEQILVGAQSAEGNWYPRNGNEKSAGAVYATSLALLSLSIHHHFLPIYQK